MSKAFTKDDGADEPGPARPLGPPLPEGARNYVTPAGARALAEQLHAAQLAVDRLKPLGGAAFLTARDQLQFWQRRFERVEVIEPSSLGDEDPIRFGATVVLDGDDGEQRVRIVGVDEADAARGDISWTSPLARALMGRRVGDEVDFRAPKGRRRLEVVEVHYRPAPHAT